MDSQPPSPQLPPPLQGNPKRFLSRSGHSFELSTRSLFRNPNNDTRKKLITVIITLFADIVLPVVLYFVLKMWIDAVWALLAAAGPAFLSVLVKLILKRQLDLIGLLVFFAFGITGVVAITTHNARILLMEKSIVTAVLGFVFWLTLIPIPMPSLKRKKHRPPPDDEEVVPTRQPEPKPDRKLRPFLFYAFKQLIPLGKMDIRITGYEIGRYEWFWLSLPSFKKHLRVLTALWGFGLLAEFGGRLAMVVSNMTTDQVVLYANVYFAVLLGILLIISGVYGFRAKRGLVLEIDAFLAARRIEIQESHSYRKLQLEKENTANQQYGNTAQESSARSEAVTVDIATQDVTYAEVATAHDATGTEDAHVAQNASHAQTTGTEDATHAQNAVHAPAPGAEDAPVAQDAMDVQVAEAP